MMPFLLFLLLVGFLTGLSVYLVMERTLRRIRMEQGRALSERDSASRLLEQERSALAQRLQDKEEACTRLLREKDEACTRLLNEKTRACTEALAERGRLITESVQTLQAKFSSLASDLLAEKTKKLSSENGSQIHQLLEPLRQQMEAFRNAAENAQKSNTQISASLATRMDSFLQMASQVGQKAEGLTNALRAGNKLQGNWGEQILSQLLNNFGLREGIDFLTQEGSRENGFPDVQVIDEQQRFFIIDSKTSLTDYLKACNAENEEIRTKSLKDHVASVKKHIDELARKEYPLKLGKAYPERRYMTLVGMFLPNEAAHMTALLQEPSLPQYASERNILLLSPLTLFSYLRLVSLVKQQQRLDQNYLEITKQGEILLERINSCLKAAEDLGSNFTKNYETLMGLLGAREGKHNMLSPARELMRLGVKLQKPKAKSIARFQPENNADADTDEIAPGG